MEDFLKQLPEWVDQEQVYTALRVVVLLVAGFILARIVRSGASRLVRGRVSLHLAQVLQRFAYYGVLAMIGTSVLRELGFKLNVLLGAAGVMSVAIGFASQTSMSNLISGFFLLMERPFVITDVIKIGDTTGEVLSIDLLSLKLRTFDNLYVRIPNQTVLSSEVTNYTHFPIRRIDILVGVAYNEDLSRVREVLLEVADRNPLSLEEPEPLYMFKGFGDSSLDLQFSVWAKRENYLALKNSLQEEIKEAFDQQGIDIPFPHRTLYASAQTGPLPVQMVGERLE